MVELSWVLVFDIVFVIVIVFVLVFGFVFLFGFALVISFLLSFVWSGQVTSSERGQWGAFRNYA